MKKILLIITIGIIFITGCESNNLNEISFADSKLENQIRNEINKKSGKITSKDLDEITSRGVKVTGK